MRENRHLRFADVSGLQRDDLPIAAEIWLEDLVRQAWMTRDIAKLSIHFKRYLERPDSRMMELHQIENECHLERERIVDALRQMYAYGAVSGYAIEGNVVRVSLLLTLLQRLRVLETRKRWTELCAIMNRQNIGLPHEQNAWLDEPLEDDPVPSEA